MIRVAKAPGGSFLITIGSITVPITRDEAWALYAAIGGLLGRVDETRRARR